MTTIWAFILVIGVLVFIHELGHYLAARSVGVKVHRFSIGFPPRLLSFTSVKNGWKFRLFFYRRNKAGKLEWGPLFKKRIRSKNRKGSGTEYCFALIPLGGYVKMAGLIDESMDTTISSSPDELNSKSPLAQAWVMSAGVIMNMILAFFIFTFIVFASGIPEYSNEPVIEHLSEDKPAQEAGLLKGDRIAAINGKPIETWEDMAGIIHTMPNTFMNFTIERGDRTFDQEIKTSFQIVPVDGHLDTLGIIGISPAYSIRDISIMESLSHGVRLTGASLNMIFESLAILISGEASVKELGGPIMIAQMAGESARAGFLNLLSFMALISVNLAFINILPIPGLDGGHIFIILIQLVIRRPLSVKTRLIIQQVGMVLLMMLFVTVIYNDIGRLFSN